MSLTHTGRRRRKKKAHHGWRLRCCGSGSSSAAQLPQHRHTHTTDTGRGNNTNEANIQAALRLTRALYPHLLDDTGAADVTRCCIQQVWARGGAGKSPPAAVGCQLKTILPLLDVQGNYLVMANGAYLILWALLYDWRAARANGSEPCAPPPPITAALGGERRSRKGCWRHHVLRVYIPPPVGLSAHSLRFNWFY